MKVLFKVIAMSLLTLTVVGCSRPETPQETAAAFWQAMVDNDAGEVADLSTLSGTSGYDRYARTWTDTAPTLGRVVIDQDQATVVTKLPAGAEANDKPMTITTYLVRQDGNWLVDYKRTGEAVMHPSPLSGLIGQLSELGDRITASFDRSSDDLSRQMSEFSREFEAFSDQAGRQAEQTIERYGEALQAFMKKLEQSVQEALNENQQAPSADRQALQQTAASLHESRARLDDPDFQTLADSSSVLAQASEKLTHLSDTAFDRYQPEWTATLQAIRERTNAFFSELRTSLHG